MRKFLPLNRVCVPLSLDCDLNCRYCYRNAGRIPRIPEFNDLMKEFLGQLDPKKTQALVASGGEPLLHWEKVKELWSYAHPDIHKKVMTNALNLPPEIIEYLNEHDVETWVSHDGDASEYLRGVDVLRDPDLKPLILSIKNLTFSCCCTNKNPDPYQCYQEIKALVDRPFYFHYNAVFSDAYCSELTEGFDYKAYQRGALLCLLDDLDYKNPIVVPKRGVPLRAVGTNVLPNGDVVGMAEIHHKYGTVLSTIEEIRAKQAEYGDLAPCSDEDICPVGKMCGDNGLHRTAHSCAVAIKNIEVKVAVKEYEREKARHHD